MIELPSLEMIYNVSVASAGTGGHRMAARTMKKIKESGYGLHSYVALETNAPAIPPLKADFESLGFPGSQFQSVLVPIPVAEGRSSLSGTGFRPELAEKAMASEVIRHTIDARTKGVHFLFAFFALAKGTGRAVFYELARQCRNELDIIPILVLSLPSRRSPAFSAGLLDDCKERLERVIDLGLRVIAIDTTILHTEAFNHLTPEEGWAYLDESVAQAICDTMFKILADPSRDHDATDAMERLIITAEGQGGYITPVSGTVFLEDGGDQSTPVTVTSAAASRPNKEELKRQQDQVKKGFSESERPIYITGDRLDFALVEKSGPKPWNLGMRNALENSVADFNPNVVYNLKEKHPEEEAKNPTPEKISKSSEFRILDFDSPKPTPNYTFAALIASTFCKEEPKPAGYKHWRFYDATTIPEVSEVSEVVAAPTLQTPPPGAKTEEPPVVEPAEKPDPLNKEVLLTNVFVTKVDPKRITFFHLVQALRTGKGYASAKLLLSGTPEQCAGVCNGLLQHLSAGTTRTFGVHFHEVLASLPVLSQHEGTLSDEFQQLLVKCCLDAGYRIPDNIEFRDGFDKRQTIDWAQVSEEKLSELSGWEFESAGMAALFNNCKRLKKVLSPEVFGLLLVKRGLLGNAKAELEKLLKIQDQAETEGRKIWTATSSNNNGQEAALRS